MESEHPFTTLRLCARCQAYKPRKDFGYIEGRYVCTDCGHSATKEQQRVNSAKPDRNSDE
jgi:transposase-like protein